MHLTDLMPIASKDLSTPEAVSYVLRQAIVQEFIQASQPLIQAEPYALLEAYQQQTQTLALLKTRLEQTSLELNAYLAEQGQQPS